MAGNRTVTVSLIAQVNGYVNGMQKAAAETRNMGSEAEKLAQKKDALNQLALGVGGIGAAAAAGTVAAIKAFADFDAQMAQVQTLSHATAGEMNELRTAALNMGQGIGFSATQVADAETELTKAGVSVKDQLGGALVGALDLAAAGQINVADATEIAASAMTQFKLKGSDVPHIADLLAAGADKALGSVQDLGNGLKYVGPVSESLGVSLEQTVGTLAEFAQNGIIGEQAGTELRGTLLSLTAPSQAASDVMKQYGINLYNAQGNFIGIDGAAQQLKDKLGPLDQATRTAALGQIFGNAQITAANVLYAGGAKSVDKWTAAVNDNGFASQQAAGKMDSLSGDLSKLKAAFESGLIETGSASNGALRSLTQAATKAIEAFDAAPQPVKDATLAIAGATAAVGLGGAAFLSIVPKIGEAKIALQTLGITAEATKAQLAATGAFLTGPLGIALGTAAAAEIAFNVAASSGAASQKELQTAIEHTVSATKLLELAGQRSDLSKTLVGDSGQELKDIPALLDKAGSAWNTFFSFISIGGAASSAKTEQALKSLKSIGSELADVADSDAPTASKAFAQLAASQNLTNSEMTRLLNGPFSDYKSALSNQAIALGISTSKQNLLLLATGQYTAAAAKAKDPTQDNVTALNQLQSSADDATSSINDTASAIKGFNSAQLDVDSTQRDLLQSISDVTGAITDNGKSLDVNTDAGRKNAAGLDEIAQNTLNYASALYTQTGSQADATNALESGRDSLIKALGQYGVTGQAAEDYANKILGTPTSWATIFTNNAGTAKTPVDNLKTAIATIPAGVNSNVVVNTGDSVARINATTSAVNGLVGAIQRANSEANAGSPVVAHYTGGSQAYATGGPVFGPGTGRSDSINAKLSNGEFVVTAETVQRVGLGFLMAMNNGSQGGVDRRYAAGGYVRPPVYVPAPLSAIQASSAQQQPGPTRSDTYNLYSLDPEPYAQAVIRRQNLGFV